MKQESVVVLGFFLKLQERLGESKVFKGMLSSILHTLTAAHSCLTTFY